MNERRKRKINKTRKREKYITHAHTRIESKAGADSAVTPQKTTVLQTDYCLTDTHGTSSGMRLSQVVMPLTCIGYVPV
jgi:hypothetical protein